MSRLPYNLRRLLGGSKPGRSTAGLGTLPAGARHRHRQRLRLESLEDRCTPAWTAVGPAPQLQPSPPYNTGPVTGRVSAVAITNTHIQQAPTLFLGAAGGGVWKSV